MYDDDVSTNDRVLDKGKFVCIHNQNFKRLLIKGSE